jgi:hypothetical protein
VTCQNALGIIFALLFELIVAVCSPDLRRRGLPQHPSYPPNPPYLQPLESVLEHDANLLLHLGIHFLHLLHEVDIVVAVFLEQEDLDDFDEMLEHLVDYFLHGELGGVEGEGERGGFEGVEGWLVERAGAWGVEGMAEHLINIVQNKQWTSSYDYLPNGLALSLVLCVFLP